MTKFQDELRTAIEELLICHSSTNQEIMESLISRACDIKALELCVDQYNRNYVDYEVGEKPEKPEYWIAEAEKGGEA